MRKPKKDHHALTPEQRAAFDSGFTVEAVRHMAGQAKLALSDARVSELAETLNWWRSRYRKSVYEPEPGKPAVPAAIPTREGDPKKYMEYVERTAAAVAPPALRMTEPNRAAHDLSAALADRALAFAQPIAETIERLALTSPKAAFLKFIALAVPAITGETITSPEAVRVHLSRARKTKS